MNNLYRKKGPEGQDSAPVAYCDKHAPLTTPDATEGQWYDTGAGTGATCVTCKEESLHIGEEKPVSATYELVGAYQQAMMVSVLPVLKDLGVPKEVILQAGGLFFGFSTAYLMQGVPPTVAAEKAVTAFTEIWSTPKEVEKE